MAVRTDDLRRVLPELGLSSFPGLDEQRLKLLCFLAWCVEMPSETVLQNLGYVLTMTQKETNESLNTLRNLGYIERQVSLSSKVVVSPKWYIKAMAVMCISHPEWKQKFSRITSLQYSAATRWTLILGILNGDADIIRRYRKSRQEEDFIANLDQYLSPLALEPSFSSVIKSLSTADFRKVISTALWSSVEDGTISGEVLDRMSLFSEKILQSRQLQDEIAGYRFLLDGGPEFWNGRAEGDHTLWSFSCKAISLMYQGALHEAFEEFTKALDEGEPRTRNQGMFQCPVLSFYYGICLYRLTCGDDAEKAVRTARRNFEDAYNIRYGRNFSGIDIFLTYADSTSEKVSDQVSAAVTRMLTRNDNCWNRAMALLLLGHFSCSNTDTVMDGYAVEDIPHLKLLRYELSCFMPMPPQQKNELRETLCGVPIFKTLRRKEVWEQALSSLQSTILSAKAAERRILYFFEGMWLTAIVEETRQSDGEWSARPVSEMFRKLKMDYPDPVDRQIAMALKCRDEQETDAEIIMPLLIGSDRMFSDPKTLRNQISIDVVPPYLSFEMKGTRIEVTTNAVMSEENGRLPKCSVLQLERSRYQLIPLTSTQHSILTKILMMGSFPLSAFNSVKELARQLKDIMEVRTDLAMAEVIPRIVGTDTLAVRITPVDDQFRINVQSCPVPDGQERFTPGEGDPDIFDTEGGILKMVIRNLLSEKERYRNFRDFVETRAGIQFADRQNFKVTRKDRLLQILNYIHDNRDGYILEWPKGRAIKFRGNVRKNALTVQVSTGVRWFKIEGRLALEGGLSVSLKELLAACAKGGDDEYIQISDTEFVKMSRELQGQVAALNDLMLSRGNEMTVPQYHIGQLARVLGNDGGLGAQVDEGFDRLLTDMRAAYSMTPALPAGLNARLRPYQKEGYEWLVKLSSWGAGACLADDMGLGKTLESLAFILSRADRGASLIVAPKSVVPNWRSECVRFTPGLRMIVLNDEKDRGRTIDESGSGDVIVTTYGMLVTRQENLRQKHWNVVCLDEAHQIKNRGTRCSSAVMSLTAQSRLILTGTPIQNHLGDMWNLFQFINPGLLGPWQEFADKYIKVPCDNRRQENLRMLTQPFILRRTKEQVLSDLPEKISYTHLVEMSDEEMTLYEQVRTKAEDFFDKAVRGEKKKGRVKISFFDMLTRLRLIANSASLVFPEWTKTSSKIEALTEMLENITTSAANQVLVFSQFTSFLSQIKPELENRNIDYIYLDGQTSLKEREMLIRTFQSGEVKVFLISLKAGGLGLNLTAANHVILLDPWWNPAIEDQAIDRAHRMGQKRSVMVVRMVSAGTIEEKILRLHETKRDLADKMMEGTADSGRLTMDDILDMVSPFR